MATIHVSLRTNSKFILGRFWPCDFRMAADLEYYKLLHIRNIDGNLSEEEFLNYCRSYGHVTRYTWIPSRREALVEMDRLAADNFIQSSRSQINLQAERIATMIVTAAQIRSMELQNLLFNILRTDHSQQIDQSKPRGRVLRVQVSNVKLPVTARSVQRIFETMGKVEVVAITGPKPFDTKYEVIQFLIQYSKREEAFQAFNKLDGKWMQELSCKLDIYLTELNELHICYNFVRQPEWVQGIGDGRRTVLLIKNIYNVQNDRNIVTPQMVFNIFSLYGRVLKIKFFLTTQTRNDQPVTVMNGLVQMESPTEAARAEQFLNKFYLFRHWSLVTLSDKKYTIQPDAKTVSDPRFRVLNCEASASQGGGMVTGNSVYDIHHRTNTNFLDFKPTRIIRISDLPQNVTSDYISQLMTNLYGSVVALRLEGTSCDIMFLGVNEATTALACQHGQLWAGRRISVTFLPENHVPTPQTFDEKMASISWPIPPEQR